MIILGCGFFFIFSAFLFLSYTFYQVNYNLFPEWKGKIIVSEEMKPVIIFENLTEKELQIANHIVDSVDLAYLQGQKKIIITKSYDNHCYDGLSGCVSRYSGYNNGKGEMVVFFSSSATALKRTLCHELLHTYMLGTNRDYDYSSPVHVVIKSLSDQNACYKDTESWLIYRNFSIGEKIVK